MRNVRVLPKVFGKMEPKNKYFGAKKIEINVGFFVRGIFLYFFEEPLNEWISIFFTLK